jgi:nucleotide-binding universal stress UspA family protein
MTTLVLVPFDGGPVAQAALRAACLGARRDGTLVAALYVALIPRQLPLRADLPWLARETTRIQLLAEPIFQETGANAWAEWVCARELAPAIAGVARELEASRILLGIRRASRHPAWLRYWSVSESLRRLAPCPVDARVFPLSEAVGARMSTEALS